VTRQPTHGGARGSWDNPPMRARWMFSYVVDHDEGYSPNPVGGLCTLAHCKFSQSGRRNLVEMAQVGDWIVGTGGKSASSAGHGRLIYAMRVTDKIPLRAYLTARQYAGRADRYPPAGSDQERFALISDDFYYFGRNAIHIAGIPTRHLNHPLEKRGPRHRHDFTEAFIADFEQWIARKFSVGVHGEPCAGTPPHWRPRRSRCVPVRRRPATICHPKRC
jgi:hypothetical protein